MFSFPCIGREWYRPRVPGTLHRCHIVPWWLCVPLFALFNRQWNLAKWVSGFLCGPPCERLGLPQPPLPGISQSWKWGEWQGREMRVPFLAPFLKRTHSPVIGVAYWAGISETETYWLLKREHVTVLYHILELVTVLPSWIYYFFL